MYKSNHRLQQISSTEQSVVWLCRFADNIRQVNLWHLNNMCHTWAHLSWGIMMRHYKRCAFKALPLRYWNTEHRYICRQQPHRLDASHTTEPSGAFLRAHTFVIASFTSLKRILKTYSSSCNYNRNNWTCVTVADGTCRKLESDFSNLVIMVNTSSQHRLQSWTFSPLNLQDFTCRHHSL